MFQTYINHHKPIAMKSRPRPDGCKDVCAGTSPASRCRPALYAGCVPSPLASYPKALQHLVAVARTHQAVEVEA